MLLIVLKDKNTFIKDNDKLISSYVKEIIESEQMISSFEFTLQVFDRLNRGKFSMPF